MRVVTISLCCLLAMSGIARATYDDPKTAAKWGLSDDQTPEQMAKVVKAKIKKMIGKKVSVDFKDSEGAKGKCSNEDQYPRNAWRQKFVHLLSAMQFMSEDEIGKKTLKKSFKGFRWVCYSSNGHDGIEWKDGILTISGNPQFFGFTGEGQAYGRRRYHQFKEETTRFGDEDVGDMVYAIYDDDSTGTSISYERAARYGRDVMIPTYTKKYSELLGGPVEIEIDFDHARCIEHDNAACGNPYGQQDKLLITLFEGGIATGVKGFEEAFDHYKDDHDAGKLTASKKALLKQVKKIRFSWRAKGDEDDNGRVDFKLEGGVLTILPGRHSNYLADKKAITEFLKKKVPGFLPD